MVLQSRYWPRVLLVSAALLIVDVTAIVWKGNTARQPMIDDVFTKQKAEFSNDLGQLLTIVPPTNYVAPVQEAHGPQYRTADWLRAQGSLAWTLQIFQSEDEQVVKDYLVRRPDKELFAYVPYKNGEQRLFLVLYGSYASRELALGVSSTTDFGLDNGARPAPEKFMVIAPYVPVIEPAIDQPPAPKYGDVPVPTADPEPVEPAPADAEPTPATEPPEPEPSTSAPEPTVQSGNI